jgi:hypothetical protein
MCPRAVAALLTLALAAASVVGCDGDDKPAARPSPTYPGQSRAVRVDERPLRGGTVRDGEFLFTAIGLTDRMRALFGSHAEFPADGQFVRVRLVIENTGTNIQRFYARQQLLITDTGTRQSVDPEAMTIKRQLMEVDVGSGVRVEFDLWYDIPVTAKPTAIWLVGRPPLGSVAPTDGVRVELVEP